MQAIITIIVILLFLAFVPYAGLILALVFGIGAVIAVASEDIADKKRRRR